MALGKFKVSHAPAEDMEEFVAMARRMVKDYGWEDEVVHPWEKAEKITSILDMLSDYKECSYSSQSYLIDLANGLAGILNAWEDVEINGVTICNPRTGRKFKVSKEDAEWLANECEAYVIEGE